MSNSNFDQEETNLSNDNANPDEYELSEDDFEDILAEELNYEPESDEEQVNNDNANPDEYELSEDDSGEILNEEQCYESEPDCDATGTDDSGNCYPSEDDLNEEQVHGDYDQNIDNRSNTQSNKDSGESFQKVKSGVKLSQDVVKLSQDVVKNIKETLKGNQGVSQPSQGSPRSNQGVSQSSQGSPRSNQGVSQPSQGSPRSNQGVSQPSQGSPRSNQGVSQSSQAGSPSGRGSSPASQGKSWVISFQWEYEGKPNTKRISKEEATRENLNGPIIRIGRDKSSCNLHLENESVSRQQAEIYFNEQQQTFFIQNLHPKNITQVDGKNLSFGKELLLKEGGIIVLGQQKIEVTNIRVYDVKETNYSIVHLPRDEKTTIIHEISADSQKQKWEVYFRWQYNKKSIEHQISQEDSNKNNQFKGIIRIGRDKNLCTIQLEHESVSRQHAQIYFDKDKQKLFIKSLQPEDTKIITKIDGQDLVNGKGLPLKQKGTIILGQQKIEYNKQKELEIETKKWWNSLDPILNSTTIKVVGAIIVAFLTYVFGPKIAATIANQKDYSQAFTKHTESVLNIKLDENKAPDRYYYVKLYNFCESDVKFAYSFLALDDVRQTKGWYTLDKNQPTVSQSLESFKGQALLYLFAYTSLAKTEDNQKQEGQEVKLDAEWIIYNYNEPSTTPDDKYLPKAEDYDLISDKNNYLEKYVPRLRKNFLWFTLKGPENFDYIDTPFLEPDIQDKNPKPEKFYRIQFDFQSNDKRGSEKRTTTRAFICPTKDKLKLVPLALVRSELKPLSPELDKALTDLDYPDPAIPNKKINN